MTSDVRGYRDMVVWQRSMDVAVAVYELSSRYPREELFGLTSQSRRAAASVAANIAEGYGRASKQAYVNFLKIAQGSLKELETHLILATRVGLAPHDATEGILSQTDEVGRMLRGLIGKLNDHPGR